MGIEPTARAQHEPPRAPRPVCVTVSLDVPARAAWRALTEPGVVRGWFGELSGPLRPGGSAILDFQDGDFFAIEDVLLHPPHRLEYAWRFLGLGPLEAINWQITPRGGGCRVTVTDAEPGRPAEAATALREGWADFTDRLARFLATGRPCRYDCRSEFEASVELACSPGEARQLLHRAGLNQWLPLDGPVGAGGRLILDDLAAFAITEANLDDPAGVSFHLARAGVLPPTRCRLSVCERRGGAQLSVSHSGWVGAEQDKAELVRLRRRFSTLWIGSLKRARSLSGAIRPGQWP